MARKQIDIALDEADDLMISSDFAATESTNAHQKSLLISEKGEWKENPGVGVGALSYLDDEKMSDLIRMINHEFTKDGMKVNSVKQLSNGELETDAYYE